MAVSLFSKTGIKSTAAVKLDKKVFGVKVTDHQLIKEAYLAHLANGRANLAITKKRGEVSGGGRKPWRQKGTGRARAGSIRSPLWRGGGITFGPTGLENYKRKQSTQSKRSALRQALSLAAESGKLIIIEDFIPAESKTKAARSLLDKIGATGSVLMVLGDINTPVSLALRNLASVKYVQAKYLNVFEIMNADHLVVSRKALDEIQIWLGGGNE